jgi:hypothetical protein
MKEKTKFRVLMAWLVFVLAVTLLGPIAAFAADSGACYAIQDSDARTYCLARAHRESGRCYSIKSADTRSQCLAEVRK